MRMEAAIIGLFLWVGLRHVHYCKNSMPQLPLCCSSWLTKVRKNIEWNKMFQIWFTYIISKTEQEKIL